MIWLTWFLCSLTFVCVSTLAARCYRRWRDLEDRRIRNDRLHQYSITPRINHQLKTEDES